MTNKKFLILFFAVFVVVSLVNSCATNNSTVLYSVVETPADIRAKAVSFAHEYVQRDTLFEWGERDTLEKEGVLQVDCSGFIVRVFQYAVKDTKYSLLFTDTNVSSLYSYFSIPVDTPSPGDFIFMGTNSNWPTHMSIFVSMDDENIYFIDSTLKEEDGIDGVTFRHYAKDDPRFLLFARLLVRL